MALVAYFAGNHIVDFKVVDAISNQGGVLNVDLLGNVFLVGAIFLLQGLENSNVICEALVAPCALGGYVQENGQIHIL